MKKAALSVILILILGCVTGNPTMEREVVRTAQDAPEAFDPPAGFSWGDEICKNPIIDPIDGSELIMVRSSGGMGDYKVTGVKYGVNRGELLRINCRTGGVVGIVKQ